MASVIQAGNQEANNATAVLHRLASHGVIVRTDHEERNDIAADQALVLLIEEICVSLRQNFGDAPELSLESYQDPEQPDEYLTLYVRQESYQAGFLDRIENVLAPFAERLDQLSCHLLVTTDFHRPRGKHVV